MVRIVLQLLRVLQCWEMQQSGLLLVVALPVSQCLYLMTSSMMVCDEEYQVCRGGLLVLYLDQNRWLSAFRYFRQV